jgi:hypothetical protein
VENFPPPKVFEQFLLNDISQRLLILIRYHYYTLDCICKGVVISATTKCSTSGKGIVSAINAYLIGGVTGKMMAGLMPGMESIIAISTIIGAFLGIFVFWVVWTGVFYLVSLIFKGQGTFKRTLEFVGYGYLPQIFGAILTSIVVLQYIPKIIVPRITSAAAQDPQLIQDAIKALMHDPAMMEMTQITLLISIVFLLWSANIWIFGIQKARNLSTRDSALCVAIPVVGYILYLVYTMVVM